ncbi:MAG: flagellar hook-length control protein FliK, partial [Hydrogenophaga sp.]
STATPASPTPAHGPQAHAAGARPAHLQGQRTQAPADLFATLLALAADATPADASDPLAATDTAAQGTAQDADDKDNPLAGLMFWQPQGPLEQAHAAQAGGDSARGSRATNTTPDRAAADALREPSARADEPAVQATDTAAATAATPATSTRPSGPSWQVMASRAAQTAPAGSGGDAPATRWSRAAPESPTHAPAWGLRSTVNLDPRFPAAAQTAPGAAQATAPATGLMTAGAWADDVAPANTGERTAIGGAAPAAGPAASGSAAQADMNSGQGGSGEGSDSAGTAPDGNGQGDDTQNAHASDAEAVDVQHWGGTHGLRHASLRVGEDAARAIDIQLALRGDEVQLDIRTDDSATRDALREQAQAALGERLQQGGLQLGNVSVGAQKQERQREGHTPTLAQARTGGESGAETAAPQQARAAERAGGLDLFI